MIDALYEKINYISGIPFIFSRFIREYDISKANISILFKKKVLDKDTYIRLYNADRMERQIFIGKLQRRNPKIVEILQQGIIESKRDLFISNNLTNDDILAIKNDAVFTIDRDLHYTSFDGIEFKLKNIYTSFMRIGNIELYYWLDKISNSDKIDIKGLGKKKHLHDDYITDFIEFVFNSIESGYINELIINIMAFHNKYINRELDIGYYREYNSDSYYRIYGTQFCLDDLSNTRENKFSIDISYNDYIITTLYRYVSSIYMNNR